MIRIAQPLIGPEEEQAVLVALRSGQLVQGPRVAEFEEAFAHYIGARHAVALSSGTSALVVALRAHGIGSGDEVIVPTFTYAATANAVLLAGARPVLVDVRGDDFTIDAAAIEAAITAKTRAVVPVHLYGHPCDMTTIGEIAQRRNLIVIEDACQALGAEWRSRKAGSFGTGCFSFYATKHITTGEGGMLVTDDDDVASRARLLRNQGEGERYRTDVLGDNHRMTEIAAALGLAQLEKLDGWNERRRANAAWLNERLAGVTTPAERLGARHAYHLYTVRAPAERRDALRAAVIGAGAMGANHVRVLRELDATELVAVADTDAARLATAAEGGTRGFHDYRALLVEERPEAVVVAVPTRLHSDVALACIEAGVPVLVEKPLASTFDEAERLREAADAHDVPLTVGHIERFNPAVRELKRHLDGGEIGRVVQLRARRVGPFYQRERDVGVVHDLATHDIDVFRYLLGQEVEAVQAETQRGVRTEFEDSLAALLRFEGGAVGSLEVSWLEPAKVRELGVLGERGMLVADYLTQELRRYEFLTPEGAARPASETFAGAGEAPLRAELEAFAAAARREAPPAVNAADGIAAIRVAEALVEAGRRGETVRLLAGGAMS